MLFFLRVHFVGKKLNSENQVNLKKLHALFNHGNRTHASWLAFEDVLVLISPRLHSKRVITEIAAKVIITNFVLNE